MDLAARLRAEATATDERRLLVIAGEPAATRERARDALAVADIDSSETTLLGSDPFLDCEHHEPRRASELLGRTRTAVVYDAHDAFVPNALGQAVGAVDGGGLFVLLTPPLDAWPDTRDGFDETLAVPPFDTAAVAGHFRGRVVDQLWAHRGVAIVDADGTVEREGLTDPAPRAATPAPSPPVAHDFPTAAYDACLTQDQSDALAALEALGESGTVVLEADRGRGKSSVAGLAAGSLATADADVLVTAPQYGRARELFGHARTLLSALDVLTGVDEESAPHCLESGEARVRFCDPVEATDLPGDPDVVFVDEAAALPVRILERFLAAPAVAFTTTIHGYEGAGRGFSVRFRDRLADSERAVTDVTMDQPIRYAAGDPVEVWATRALLLDARPAVDPLVADAQPETVEYEALDSAALLSDEHLLREAFGLLVLAHYRTEPDDLARLLDAPNVTVRALTHDGHVVSVALLAREGGLGEDLRASMYEGQRVRGNMLPDVLTTQLRDEAAAEPVGWRVLRIATHPAARERGLGTRLLDAVAAEADAETDLDWLGVGFGATPELLSFWAGARYRTLHLSTTRNERSGEHSAIMLRPLSSAGEALGQRHAEWFCQRVGGMLTDPLSELDSDVVLGALSALEPTVECSLSPWEWRLLAGTPFGAGMYDTSPEAYRALALHALTDDDGPALDERERAVLVQKVLQGRTWERVAQAQSFHSSRECMQTVGRAVESLVDAYGTETALAELERFR